MSANRKFSSTIPATAVVAALLCLLSALLAPPAQAAVSVSKAEVTGTALRIDGTALASRDISVDNVVMGRSDGAGKFRISRDPYAPPADCTVDLRDDSPTVTNVRLEGCTVTTSPPPTSDNTAPTTPTNLVTTVVGTTIGLSWNPSTDDTAATGYRVTRNGTVIGTTDDTTFQDAGLAPGTYTYTVAAFDAAGNTSAQSNSASGTVEQSEPLHFLTPSQLPDATVGQAYNASIVCSDPPGPNTFVFKVINGKVPEGTRFIENTLENRPESRVIGTPTRAGTFTFTVEVEDNTGAVATRTFTIRVL